MELPPKERNAWSEIKMCVPSSCAKIKCDPTQMGTYGCYFNPTMVPDLLNLFMKHKDCIICHNLASGEVLELSEVVDFVKETKLGFKILHDLDKNGANLDDEINGEAVARAAFDDETSRYTAYPALPPGWTGTSFKLSPTTCASPIEWEMITHEDDDKDDDKDEPKPSGKVDYLVVVPSVHCKCLFDFLVEGRSREIPVDFPEQLTIALHKLHRVGVHKDIKIDNIAVCNGEVRLLDFGMARLFTSRELRKCEGTLGYMFANAFDSKCRTQHDPDMFTRQGRARSNASKEFIKYKSPGLDSMILNDLHAAMVTVAITQSMGCKYTQVETLGQYADLLTSMYTMPYIGTMTYNADDGQFSIVILGIPYVSRNGCTFTTKDGTVVPRGKETNGIYGHLNWIDPQMDIGNLDVYVTTKKIGGDPSMISGVSYIDGMNHKDLMRHSINKAYKAYKDQCVTAVMKTGMFDFEHQIEFGWEKVNKPITVSMDDFALYCLDLLIINDYIKKGTAVKYFGLLPTTNFIKAFREFIYYSKNKVQLTYSQGLAVVKQLEQTEGCTAEDAISYLLYARGRYKAVPNPH